MPHIPNAYANAQRAGTILEDFGAYAQFWAALPQGLPEELLETATLQIDALPCLFPKYTEDQLRRYPVACNDVECGLQEAEYATVLQALHLALHAEELLPDVVERIPSQTICFENSAECIEYALGALLILEGYIDLGAMS